MKVSRKTVPASALCAVAIAGAVAVGAAPPALAASGSWTTSGMDGVYASGTYSTSGGRLYVSGYVRDVTCDGRGAQVSVYFTSRTPEAWPYRHEVVVNNSGCNTNKHFSFNSSNRGVQTHVEIYEGLTNPTLYSIRGEARFYATP